MYTEQRFLKAFGKRLARIRKQRGFTQESLAEEVGLHFTYIGMVERGTRNPTIANVYKISKVLKVDIRELF
jgi:transcriptional regulator with XRE-family HTH domain